MARKTCITRWSGEIRGGQLRARIIVVACGASRLVAWPHGGLAQEARFALVIGNDPYRTATLATSANDAGLVADAQGAAGFAVTAVKRAAIKPSPSSSATTASGRHR